MEESRCHRRGCTRPAEVLIPEEIDGEPCLRRLRWCRRCYASVAGAAGQYQLDRSRTNQDRVRLRPKWFTALPAAEVVEHLPSSGNQIPALSEVLAPSLTMS